MDRKSDAYKLIKSANVTYLFCIIFEIAGTMTIMFYGEMGAQIAIYFMTLLFAVFMAKKKKLAIPFTKPKLGTSLASVLISVLGIPIAMVLSMFASFFSAPTVSTADDITQYPIWLSLIVLAVIPAFVEEYVFRGFILGAYETVDKRSAVLISSLFFALIHMSVGQAAYGFFYGCVFALVRLATGNVIYSMLMHFTFNAASVAVSYTGDIFVTGWIVATAFAISLIGFIIMCIMFFKRHPVQLSSSKYAKRQLVTKEGYVTMAVCVSVMVLLLAM